MKDPFPNNFAWGVASAAFQIEGAAAEDGKGPSIWDVFCATPGKTERGETGALACDHYHRWRDDIALMKQLNINAYRFSVSWPRILPAGRGAVNARGLDFYDALVDGLLAAGIQPAVTLYHWDLPAALQMELGGWSHPDLPRLFADYAALLFDRLGDRVPLWLTLNEPWCVARHGHMDGSHAPGARNDALGYLVGHNLLRAHAYAVARLRAARRDAAVGMAVNTTYNYPATDSPHDVAAAQLATETFGGWFADPPVTGDYPSAMRNRLGWLLPEFNSEDAQLLKGSFDFLGLNYYSADVIRHALGQGPFEFASVPQPDAQYTTMNWAVRPDGLRDLLGWLNRRYPGLPIYITENGAAFDDRPDPHGEVDDPDRIAYLRSHIAAVRDARARGADVRGYFLWSLLDNLEWAHGFSRRFGIVRCDFETQRRTIKSSGRWYARLIAQGGRE